MSDSALPLDPNLARHVCPICPNCSHRLTRREIAHGWLRIASLMASVAFTVWMLGLSTAHNPYAFGAQTVQLPTVAERVAATEVSVQDLREMGVQLRDRTEAQQKEIQYNTARLDRIEGVGAALGAITTITLILQFLAHPLTRKREGA